MTESPPGRHIPYLSTNQTTGGGGRRNRLINEHYVIVTIAYQAFLKTIATSGRIQLHQGLYEFM